GPINRHYRTTYGFERSALHAVSIELLHPTSGARVSAFAPPPVELGECWQALGFAPELWQPERIAEAVAALPPPLPASPLLASPPGGELQLLPEEGATSVDEIAAADGFAPE
ncbi:MAG: hypothetical protein ABW217_03115, partial [Polyangiaceae bacterium]